MPASPHGARRRPDAGNGRPTASGHASAAELRGEYPFSASRLPPLDPPSLARGLETGVADRRGGLCYDRGAQSLTGASGKLMPLALASALHIPSSEGLRVPHVHLEETEGSCAPRWPSATPRKNAGVFPAGARRERHSVCSVCVVVRLGGFVAAKLRSLGRRDRICGYGKTWAMWRTNTRIQVVYVAFGVSSTIVMGLLRFL